MKVMVIHDEHFIVTNDDYVKTTTDNGIIDTAYGYIRSRYAPLAKHIVDHYCIGN